MLCAQGMTLAHVRTLLATLGDAASVVSHAQQGRLAEVLDLPEATSLSLQAGIRQADPDAEGQRLARIGGGFVTYDDPRYPAALQMIPDPPTVLRVAGDPASLTRPCVAIVGTRRCSQEALRQTARFSDGLSRAGVCIVSGGARGIDAQAHRAAITAQGATIAVMGCGMGHVYPPEHAALFDEIRASGGALVSEYPMDRGPRPGQFPRRNRLISGLSMGVLVVEAPRRSGAMLTARLAVEAHGRECWVVPADVGRSEARGGLEALRDNWCGMALDPADVLADLGQAASSPGTPEVPLVSLPDDQRAVCAMLRRHGGTSCGALMERLDEMPSGRVMAALTALEVLGIIDRRDARITLTPAGLQAASGCAAPGPQA